MKYLLAILLSLSSLRAATYYVDKTGHDTTGNGTAGLPWLTVNKAASVTVAGDTVMIGNGDFDEHVHETNSGTAGSLITYKAVNQGMAAIRGFRVGGSYTKLDGLKVSKYSGVGNTWGAAIRIEPTANNVTITNCQISDQPFVIAHDFSFPASQTIQSLSSNFITAGFVPGSKITLGACGLAPYYFANHDSTWTVATVTATTMTLTGGSAAWIADSGTGYWAYIRAGSGNSGFYALQGVEQGANSPQNCVITNNVIQDWASHAMLIDGDGWTMENNRLTRLNGYRWMTYSGSNHVFRRNIIRASRGVLHFTEDEIDALDHPDSTGWYDYQAGMFAGSSDTGNNQNVLFEENWIEDVDNQLGRVDDSHASTFGIIYRRNVFIGVTEQFSGGRDGMKWLNNTFFKTAWNIGGHPLTLGGLAADAHDGYELTGNIFAACGRQGAVETLTRGFYSTQPWNTGKIIDGNFVSSEELTGFAAKINFSEATGVNGGDPVFYNPNDPDGVDNTPFTDDDGLKVLPNSPAAALGGGALGVRAVVSGQPVAHFRVTSPTGWFEGVGDDFDPDWLALPPTQRGSVARPYTTPAAVGEAPAAVSFSADKSMSGVLGAITNTAINQYTWAWGDSTPNTVGTSPSASHTFTAPGDYTVTLTVRNTGNVTHTFSNTYRVSGALPSGGRILNVPSAYATIQAAVNAATPGDTVMIASGTYNERVSTKVSGTSDHRITMVGVGNPTMTKLTAAHDYWDFENFRISGETTQFGHLIYINGADNCTFDGLTVDGNYAYKVYGMCWGSEEGSDNIVRNCVIEEIRSYPMLNMDGERNLFTASTVRNGYDVDFVRLFGIGNTIRGNLFENNVLTPIELGEPGFHPDFVQTFGDNWDESYNHVIEQNIIRNAPVAQISQLSATGQPNIRDWTIRNNIFIETGLGASCTVPGIKYYNNVFYKCNYVKKGGNALNFGKRPFKADDGLNALHPDYALTVNPTPSGSIAAGAWYRVVADSVAQNGIVEGATYSARTRLTGRVIYNGVEYSNGQTFTGTSNPNWTKGGLPADQSTVQLYVEGGLTYNGALYLRAANATNDYVFQGVPGVTTFSVPAPQIRAFRVVLDIADRCEAKNNVFLECGNPLNNSHGWYAFDTICQNVVANWNYVGKNGFNPVRLDPLNRPIGNPGGWEAGDWYEPNGKNGGDPGMTNVVGYDFRLQGTSMLIDAGTNIAGIVNDFAGTARPLGARFDIGPYEYNDGSPPPPPPPPSPEDPPAPPILLPAVINATTTTSASTTIAPNP